MRSFEGNATKYTRLWHCSAQAFVSCSDWIFHNTALRFQFSTTYRCLNMSKEYLTRLRYSEVSDLLSGKKIKENCTGINTRRFFQSCPPPPPPFMAPPIHKADHNFCTPGPTHNGIFLSCLDVGVRDAARCEWPSRGWVGLIHKVG